jgi:hypothetical protein
LPLLLLLLSCVGVLASWVELVKVLLQMSHGLQGDPEALIGLLEVMHALPKLWADSLLLVPSAVPALVPAALPLLRQLHSYGTLLSTGTAAAAAAAAAAGPSRLGEEVWARYYKLQEACGEFVYRLSMLLVQRRLSPAVAQKALSFLCEPAVALLLLQLLTVYTMLLHQQHSEQRQHVQQSSKQQLQADVLNIPAFHQDAEMLQLLPGGQAYLATAARVVATFEVSSISKAYTIAGAMDVTLYTVQQQGRTVCAPVVSAAAVQLVLELQLLAAGAVQRQRQPVTPAKHPLRLLLANTTLLHRQLKAALQTSSGCLPPGVLQQAGLQLLQALAAPLQQVQLLPVDDPLRKIAVETPSGDAPALVQQLLGLKAAAPGLKVAQLLQATHGEELWLCQSKVWHGSGG